VQPCSLKITYQNAICKINFQNTLKNSNFFQSEIATYFAQFSGRIARYKTLIINEPPNGYCIA
jgi:hypothetical protein